MKSPNQPDQPTSLRSAVVLERWPRNMRRIHIILLTLLALAGCEPCANEIISESLSPDGASKIIVFSRNCGATTGSNTQATLLKQNQSLPNDGGNIFVLDQGKAIVKWKTNMEILVTADASSRFFKRESAVNGVSFSYQTK